MKILKRIVLCLSILVGISICFSLDSSFDKSCMYLFGGDSNKGIPYNSDLIYTDTSKSVRELTKNFCIKAQNLKCSDSSDGEHSIDYFDAKQSIFLSILCNSVGLDLGEYSQTNSYLKKKDFLAFGIITSETGYQEKCHYNGGMNDCDYSYNLPLIFNKIMNDFFSIKQARNLGIDKIEDSFKPEKGANNFSKEHLPGLTIKDGLSEGICSPETKYYKTTCNKLKGYMTDANNLLKNTEVLDVKRLQGQEPEVCENEFKDNILYCGLLGSDSYYKFINTVYNEYFWYKLFLSYYTYNINGTDYLNNTKGDVVDKLEENKEKIFLVEDQLLKSKQAITLSLQSLSEMSYSFPLHIGFLMYHEDVKFFMENLSKIYAPTRTLYDKLRNVQIKEE